MQLLRKSNCCVEAVTLESKAVLKKSQHMREGKSPFEKKFQIKLVITFN